MKRKIYYFTAVGLLIIACATVKILVTGDGFSRKSPRIAMSLPAQTGKISIYLCGSDKARIDWDDGSVKDIVLGEAWGYYEHTYADSSIARNVTVVSHAIEGLNCSDNRLAALNIGKNGTLKHLNCENTRLTSLSINRLTAPDR